MSYADRDRTAERTVGVVTSSVLLGLLIAGLATAFAAEGFRAIVKKVTTVDIKKDEPKKEPPPPPKKVAAAPPIVAPPVRVDINSAPAPVPIVNTPPPPAPVVVIPAPVGPPAAPPPPKFTPKGASPKGNPGNWATTNDYPSRALREEREGTTGFRVSVGADGRVTSCSVTNSSGSPDLDEATCSNVTRRARFTPATDGEGNPTTGSYTSRVRWVIPKE